MEIIEEDTNRVDEILKAMTERAMRGKERKVVVSVSSPISNIGSSNVGLSGSTDNVPGSQVSPRKVSFSLSPDKSFEFYKRQAAALQSEKLIYEYSINEYKDLLASSQDENEVLRNNIELCEVKNRQLEKNLAEAKEQIEETSKKLQYTQEELVMSMRDNILASNLVGTNRSSVIDSSASTDVNVEIGIDNLGFSELRKGCLQMKQELRQSKAQYAALKSELDKTKQLLQFERGACAQLAQRAIQDDSREWHLSMTLNGLSERVKELEAELEAKKPKESKLEDKEKLQKVLRYNQELEEALTRERDAYLLHVAELVANSEFESNTSYIEAKQQLQITQKEMRILSIKNQKLSEAIEIVRSTLSNSTIRESLTPDIVSELLQRY